MKKDKCQLLGSVTFCIVHFRIVTFGLGNISYSTLCIGNISYRLHFVKIGNFSYKCKNKDEK